jgi:hypothetical protein
MTECTEQHTDFCRQEVRERLQRADEDLIAGRYMEVNAADIEAALEWLQDDNITMDDQGLGSPNP